METKNLKLIPHLPAHLVALLKSEADYQQVSGRPIAPGVRDLLLAASNDYFAKIRAATAPDGWQFGFAIIQKTDRRVIGMCGFTGHPDQDGVVEIGYGVAPASEGKGYATEAARALIAFATSDSRVRTIRAHTLPEKSASTRILEKCGFQRAGESVDEGKMIWRWEKSVSRSDEALGRVTLNPSAAEIRNWGAAAIEEVANYASSLRDRPVYPRTTSREIRDRLDQALPAEGTGFQQLLDTFRDVIVESSRQSAHPRMFGYVQSPGTPIAAIADLLASTLNANLTAWRSAPATVEIERLTINWIKQIVGFDPAAAGLFVSGGSMANLSALAAARHSLGKDAVEKTARLRLYLSPETHHSISKAAGLLGLGLENVRTVRTDPTGRMDVTDLVAKIDDDLKAGHLPFCVVGNAGAVMTGAIDPLNEIAAVAKKFDLWMHVDACYGGFAMIAPSLKPLFAGLERADSVALDPHKWLYLPIDCGCVLYRDPEKARATFAHDADYTRIIGQEADEAFAFWDYGPELSRRFRALKVWMLLQGVGLREIGQAIEHDVACARHLEKLVQASDDFEMLAPVELSIFCFRHVPRPLKKASDEEIDFHNERLLIALQHDGSSYLSNAVVGGRFALRGCVMNYRTTPRDMEILLDDLRRLAARENPAA